MATLYVLKRENSWSKNNIYVLNVDSKQRLTKREICSTYSQKQYEKIDMKRIFLVQYINSNIVLWMCEMFITQSDEIIQSFIIFFFWKQSVQ